MHTILVILILYICILEIESKITSKSLLKGSKLSLKYSNKNSNRKNAYMISNAKKLDLKSDKIEEKRKQLLHVRLLFFSFYCTLGCCLPYYPVYYRKKGVSENMIGMLGSITPTVTFIISPLWGGLADTTGAYRLIMLLTFISSVVFRSTIIFEKVTTTMSLMILNVIGTAILNAPVKPLMDNAIMSVLDDKEDYGKSRLFGQLGFGLGSYLIGPFMAQDINNIFFMHALLAIPTSVLMTLFKQSKNIEDTNKFGLFQRAPRTKQQVANALGAVLRKKEIILFFSAVLLVGIASGIIENFAYVRIMEVGGTPRDMGLCRLLSSIAGGPMFYLSGYLSKVWGTNTIITLTFLVYTLRFMIYALLPMNCPLYAIPAEILRGVMWATFWACATYYVYNVAPPEATATMLGLLNGTYGGVGQSVGSLIGGQLSRKYGIAGAFKRSAVVSFMCFTVYLMYGMHKSAGRSMMKTRQHKELKDIKSS